jgi:hypothetical protein
MGGEAKRSRLSRTAVVVIAAAAGAFAVGRWTLRSPGAATPSPTVRTGPAPASASPATSTARALDPGIRDAIRAAVRDEVTAALAERDARRDGDEPSASAEPPAATSDAEAAAAIARELVEAAQRSHRWTREDAAALRAAIGRMTADQREEILPTLMVAVNRGEIQPDYPGSLY